ncbi:DUF4198 domain-containing protein [Vannielia sp.]|uniref:DUF4198 domain-containing protein n=1 Tax=Vannielia sp. TaxID=2813045 RepID=UPI00261CE414|nr:DUF4198 domain-containing protein [Vannielia sp.]MDF1874059.1 DUF4198 domain-containing protein [Vannielia sp.]
MRIVAILFCLCLGAAWPAGAHEFWLSPEAYKVPVGGQLEAEFRVGQEFAGGGYVFIPGRSARFELVTPDGVQEVTPNVGDRPALNIPAPSEGLMVVVQETTDYRLHYSEWDKFLRFVEHKDLGDTVALHDRRGLPHEGFHEAYRRCAKSLIAVGDGAGTDRLMGMPTEIVAVTNPYTDDLSGGMVVDVVHDGAARPDAQVEIFEKAPDGSVEIRTTRTDESGRASFPVEAGHEYLVDAVVMLDTGNDDPEAGAVWRSLWASLTFAVPQ